MEIQLRPIMMMQIMMIDVKINFKPRWLNVKLDILVKKFEDAQALLKWFLRKKLLNNFFYPFPKCSLPMFVLKTTIKKIGHWQCVFFGAVMGQTCPIYASTGTYQVHHFIGSWYILLQLKARVFKATLEEKLTGRKSWAYGTIWYIICGKIT